MKFLNNIDQNQNQNKNIVIDNLSTGHTTPVNGQMYYNTVDNTMYYYNGIIWLPLGKKSFEFSVARNGNVTSTQDLRRQNGTPTSDTPYIIPFACKLIAMSANTNRTGNNETWTFDLWKNNVSEATLSISNALKSYSTSYTNTFIAGDEIRFRAIIGTSGTLVKPGGTAWFLEI